MPNITLLILAAGMGSRFGGLKQIEEVGPHKEFIIDYSIYDAIAAGFTKVVFVINKENYEIFKNKIGMSLEKKVKVEYVFQDLEKAKHQYNLSLKRVKPLGTTYAILCAKEVIKEPFVIINADDFYGKEAFLDAINFLKETNYQENGAILYKLGNTLSANGEVKRGLCEIKNDELTLALECNVQKIGEKIIAKPLNNNQSFEVDSSYPVSMNMFIFMPTIFGSLEEEFNHFIKEHKTSLVAEAIIIEDLFKLILKHKITIKTKITHSLWFGMTYKEDKKLVVNNIKKKIEQGIYPDRLR